MKYKRVLLKLSGEALKNGKDAIIDFDYVKEVCQKIKACSDLGFQFGIVVGGGNVWRGRNDACIDIESSDTIGLLGTTINALSVNAVLNSINADSCIVNAFEVENLISRDKECNVSELINDKIIVFGGGTGRGGCSTDTAASNRAVEINADAIIKITNVDGVYDKDPNKYEDAVMYKNVSFDEAISKELKVLDLQAMIKCRDNNIPIIVININILEKLKDVLEGGDFGTTIY